MTIFADRSEADDILQRAPFTPATDEDFTVGGWKGAARGVLMAPAALLTTAGMALPRAVDLFRPHIEAVDSILGTTAADYVTEWKAASQRVAATAIPRPWELGQIGNLTFGLSTTLPEAIVGGLAGGAVGGGLVAGAGAMLRREVTAQRDEGVDAETASLLGKVAGLTMGVGVLMPGTVGFGSTILQRVGTDILGQAGINVLLGIPQRAADKAILEHQYPKLAAAINVFGASEIAFDAVFGGVVAGALHGLGLAPHGLARTRALIQSKLGERIAAERTAEHAAVDTRPGVPVTHADAEAHVEAMVRATEQAIAGERIDVHDVIAGARFVPAADEAATWRAATEDEIVRAAKQLGQESERARWESFGYPPRDDGEPPGPPPAAAPAKKFPVWRPTVAAKDLPPDRETPMKSRVKTQLIRDGEEVSPTEFGERARQKFLALARAYGGVSVKERADIAGERGGRGNLVGGGLFRKGGAEADALVEWMVDEGYITPAEVDGDVGGGSWRARELVRTALDGSPVYSVSELEHVAELRNREDNRTPEQVEAEARAEREAIQAESGISDADLFDAGYHDLPQVEQAEVDRWHQYADHWEGVYDEVDRIAERLGLWRDDDGAVPEGDGAPGAGRAEAGAGNDQGGESAQALAARGDGGDRQGQSLAEPDAYTRDLFGTPLPTVVAPVATAPAAPSPPVRQVSPGVFASLVAHREVGRIPVGLEHVQTPEEAAHVFAYLRKEAQENLVALLTDTAGKIINIVRHQIGGRGYTNVEVSSLIGSALRTRGAANLWIAHNHPSGNRTFSTGDAEMTSATVKAMKGSAVTHRGVFAIGGSGFSYWNPREVRLTVSKKDFINPADANGDLSSDIKPMARTATTVPIVSRTILKRGTLWPRVETFQQAVSMAAKVSGGESGIVLLNTAGEPVGWMPMDVNAATSIRGKVADQLYAGLEATNASRIIVVHKGAMSDVDPEAVKNLLRFADAANVRVLDAVALADNRSLTQSRQIPTVAGAGFKESGDDLLKAYTNDEILAREQERLAAAGVDAAQVAAAKAKAEADAQRDAFALTGSDRPADVGAARGQGALFEPSTPYGEPDLLITHNLSAENLLHAKRMGGLAAPSMAIVRKGQALKGFGEITLVGAPEMADPKGYARAQVYGADVYSPRYPNIAFKLDAKALKRLNERFDPEGTSRLWWDSTDNIDTLIQWEPFQKWMKESAKDADYQTVRSKAEDALREAGASEKIYMGFTNAGNRRYIEHTLKNVVKILTKNVRGGENFNYGVGSIRAQYAPKFASLAAIRKAKDRIVGEAEFKKVKEAIDDEYGKLIADLAQYHSTGGKSFGYMDAASSMMQDAAKMGVPRALRENAFADVPQEAMQKIAGFLDALREMPSGYFEVKIKRAVDVAEFSGAVVPEGVDARVIDALTERGVTDIREYPKGNEAARAEVLAGFKNSMFEPEPRYGAEEPQPQDYRTFPGTLDAPVPREAALAAADARVAEAEANAERATMAAVNCALVEGG